LTSVTISICGLDLGAVDLPFLLLLLGSLFFIASIVTCWGVAAVSSHQRTSTYSYHEPSILMCRQEEEEGEEEGEEEEEEERKK
jgi:hypothetical protein